MKNSVSGITSEGDDVVREGVAGRAENREGCHVGAEERQQKHGGPQRSAGKEIVFRPGPCARTTKGEDADVENDREVAENDDGWNQRRRPSSRCVGHAYVVRAHMSAADARQNAAWYARPIGRNPNRRGRAVRQNQMS